LVIVQFTDDKPNPANLKVRTPIRRVIIRGGVIEVEFDGEPDVDELETIAGKLRKNRIIRKPKELGM